MFGLIRSSKQASIDSKSKGDTESSRIRSSSTSSVTKPLEEEEENADPFSKILLTFCTNLLMLDKDYGLCYYPIYANEEEDTDYKEVLSSFMNMFTSYEHAFACLSLLMFQFLLHSSPQEGNETHQQQQQKQSSSVTRIVGYDARVRRVFQCLAVELFLFFVPEVNASRQFLALEDFLSTELLRLYQIQQQQQTKSQTDENSSNHGLSSGDDDILNNKNKNRRNMVMRGLKIGGAGVVAGTLIAVTGGMAAPALAAGIAAVAGGTIIATTASLLLTSTYAVVTIFGVGLGGGLHVASKMGKRTSGLSDFSIHYSQDKQNKLIRTIGISGWSRTDVPDNFQHPWGSINQLERLKNFLLLHSPENVSQAEDMLNQWVDKQDELWSVLQSEYGSNPGPKPDPVLPRKEKHVFSQLKLALGYPPIDGDGDNIDIKSDNQVDEKRFQKVLKMSTSKEVEEEMVEKKKKFTMWDFHSEYSGELYTIQWEKELLATISRATEELVQEFASKAAMEAVKKTALASVMTAIALPLGIIKAADMIDAPWTLICERADEAGVELARLLLQTEDGHRPVNLVGYSFGARIILSCLKELNRHQIIYVEQQLLQNGVVSEGQNKNPLKKWKRGMTKSVKNSLSSEKVKDKNSKNSGNQQQKEEDEEDVISYKREPASIIQDVIMMGCPMTLPRNMTEIRQNIVAGRMINCYHPKDWTLLTIYQYKQKTSLLGTLIGTNQINCMENYNVSNLIEWHSQYGLAVHEILSHVQFQHPNLHFQEREELEEVQQTE